MKTARLHHHLKRALALKPRPRRASSIAGSSDRCPRMTVRPPSRRASWTGGSSDPRIHHHRLLLRRHALQRLRQGAGKSQARTQRLGNSCLGSAVRGCQSTRRWRSCKQTNHQVTTPMGFVTAAEACQMIALLAPNATEESIPRRARGWAFAWRRRAAG